MTAATVVRWNAWFPETVRSRSVSTAFLTLNHWKYSFHHSAISSFPYKAVSFGGNRTASSVKTESIRVRSPEADASRTSLCGDSDGPSLIYLMSGPPFARFFFCEERHMYRFVPLPIGFSLFHSICQIFHVPPWRLQIVRDRPSSRIRPDPVNGSIATMYVVHSVA